jgi:hypothetical protein
MTDPTMPGYFVDTHIEQIAASPRIFIRSRPPPPF